MRIQKFNNIECSTDNDMNSIESYNERKKTRELILYMYTYKVNVIQINKSTSVSQSIDQSSVNILMVFSISQFVKQKKYIYNYTRTVFSPF